MRSKLLSSIMVIAFLITLSYASTIYIFYNIQQGFDKLSELNVQANRTTMLRANTLMYIQSPGIDKMQELQKEYEDWARHNVLNGYPNDVQSTLNDRSGPASGIAQYEIQLFANPIQDLYTQYVTYIGAYNLIINSSSILLVQYLDAKIVILYFTLSAIYVINIIAVVVEYFYVRHTPKNVVRAGNTSARGTIRLPETDTE